MKKYDLIFGCLLLVFLIARDDQIKGPMGFSITRIQYDGGGDW